MLFLAIILHCEQDMFNGLQKRIFVEPFLNLKDPVEVDLLYNQSVTDVFEQKIPLTKTDAVSWNTHENLFTQI